MTTAHSDKVLFRMRSNWTVIVHARRLIACAIALLLASCSDPVSPEDEYRMALAAVEDWTAANPLSWSVVTSGTQAPRRTSWSQPCSANPPSGFVALNVQTANTRVTVFFRCPVASASTAAELAAAFSHIVLEELPHRLAVPNWRFEVLTPASSLFSGVSFFDQAGGRLRIQVEAPLYALYGHSTRRTCIPPADGESAPSCFVFRQHAIPLSLSITVPFDGSALQ